MDILIYLREIWRGKDLCRILTNKECFNYELRGKVLDLGSGKNLASYHRFFKKSTDLEIFSLDLGFDRGEKNKFIDLEKELLPFKDGEIDTVLAFNLLEHIYNYNFLVSEIKRILKDGGRVLGAVPFLAGYHPDPHDYWRYSSEALKKIFISIGFKDLNIKVIGRGPLSVSFFGIEFLIPRILKFLILPIVLFFDYLFFKLKTDTNKEKFALGLFFDFSK